MITSAVCPSVAFDLSNRVAESLIDGYIVIDVSDDVETRCLVSLCPQVTSSIAFSKAVWTYSDVQWILLLAYLNVQVAHVNHVLTITILRALSSRLHLIDYNY